MKLLRDLILFIIFIAIPTFLMWYSVYRYSKGERK